MKRHTQRERIRKCNTGVRNEIDTIRYDTKRCGMMWYDLIWYDMI